jgi:putative endonuclease
MRRGAHITLGRRGEDAVAQWYVAAGYEVLDRNWRHPDGELDLVVAREGVVVFCEVKTRSGSAFGDPVEAVTPAKVRRIRRLAVSWLHAHAAMHAPHVRLDVAGVRVTSTGALQLQVLEGVG